MAFSFNPTVDPTNPHQGAVAAAGGANVFDTNYLDEMRDQLLGKIVLEGKTIDWANLIPGVKNRMSLNGIGDITSVEDASCGWNPKGDVELTQRELIVYPKQIKNAICPKDLEKTYLGMYMKTNKEIPFIGIIADQYVKVAKNYVEKFIWQGDGTNDGLLQYLYDSTINPNTVNALANMTGNLIADVNAMVTACPAEILEREDLVLCMPYEDFIAYEQALVAANLVHFDGQIQEGMTLYVPGTNIKIRATAGLNGSQNLVSGTNAHPWILTFEENIVVGTDMLNDEEVFDIWYSRDNDEVRVNVQFKIGSAVRWDDLVVIAYNI